MLIALVAALLGGAGWLFRDQPPIASLAASGRAPSSTAADDEPLARWAQRGPSIPRSAKRRYSSRHAQASVAA